MKEAEQGEQGKNPQDQGAAAPKSGPEPCPTGHTQALPSRARAP